MKLYYLPPEIISLIKDYLWGSPNIWKQKLNIKEWELYRTLLSLSFYKNNIYYCSICGEKKYISNFNTKICFSCNNPSDKYNWKYTTWSGTNQGHFTLHGKIICLY